MHTTSTRRRFRLQRQTFSIWRLCRRPYWISRLAIIYANLCWQFQRLQTIGNSLIYDTSCCTGMGGVGVGGGGGGGGSGIPLERVASFIHCHPTMKLVCFVLCFKHYIYYIVGSFSHTRISHLICVMQKKNKNKKMRSVNTQISLRIGPQIESEPSMFA